ncbi:SDR family oxidoreductase [Streptomyces sp. NPDC001635]
MDLRLTDRVIVVTGGSSGVGRAAVELLLAEGAHVATCARDGQRLERAWTQLAAPVRDRLHLQECDVRDEASCTDFIAASAKWFGRIDGVVANAGTGTRTSFANATSQQWLAELGAKVLGAVHPVRAALPLLRRSDAARIVLISGMIASEPEPGLVTASAARAALANLGRSLATELGSEEILVNTVSLGVIDTERQRQVHAASESTLTYHQWAADLVQQRAVPLARMGRPEEVAPVIALLVSPLASYINGATVTVAGGAGRSV